MSIEITSTTKVLQVTAMVRGDQLLQRVAVVAFVGGQEICRSQTQLVDDNFAIPFQLTLPADTSDYDLKVERAA